MTNSTNFVTGTQVTKEWLNDVDALVFGIPEPAGASLVGYMPAGVGAVATTVQGKLRESVSVLDFYANGVSGVRVDPTGVVDSTLGIQAAIDSVSDGVVEIPPGSYAVSTIYITGKSAGSGAGGHGGFRIDAVGAVFIGDGTGNIVIDGCKRIEIIGLDAPTHDLIWRGVWWSTFTNMRYQRLVIQDEPGLNFSSCYWNVHTNCQFQEIVVSAAATEGCNAMTWSGCSIRGSANQGFIATRDYSIEFLGNIDCQAWSFFGGDVSYPNTAVYTIGAGNASGEVEIDFYGVYFDSKFPIPISRSQSRIATHNCHAANDIPYSAKMSAASRGPQLAGRQDRSAGWAGFGTINFVPNGDFRVGMSSYAGTGLPIGAAGGATITAGTGGGAFSRYLNVSQASTSGTTRFRPKPLPFAGRYTGVLVLRNAEAGTRTIRLAFNNLYEVATISDTEWTVFTLTSGSDLSSGSQPDIQVLTDNATSFSVDVAFAGVLFGEQPPPIGLASQYGEFVASTSYNPPSITTGATASTTVSVAGADFGDFAVASFGIGLQGMQMWAEVTAAGTVTVYIRNETGITIDSASSTLLVRVVKSSYV